MQASKSNFNKLLYIAIIITAIIAGWGLSKIFSSNNISNQIDSAFSLIDSNGKKYLDGSCGAAVSCLGHSDN